ncbi:MAG: SGNH/GDSL hydrolase family protein [Proteobacteria bacterium]|jgi:hypothetical protein|nr:SGNH/GDSL hydrolase family protein [Pseudomonadota bacterium]
MSVLPASRRGAFKYSVLTLLLLVAFVEVYFERQYQSSHNNRQLCTEPSDIDNLVYSFVASTQCGTNSKGYYDYENSLEKPANTFRIVVIGDSVAQGARHGVTIEDAFPNQLENLMNADSRFGKKTEVINLSRSGYSTSQQLVLLENEAFTYGPDLIIWSYVLNDPAHPVYNNPNAELGRYHHHPTSYVIFYLKLAWSYLREGFIFGTRLLFQTGGTFACQADYHSFLHCSQKNEVIKNIQSIGGLVQRNQIPTVFMVHPIFEESLSFQDYSLAGLHHDLNELSTTVGLRTANLLAYYQTNNIEPEDIRRQRSDWFDPWHQNVLGHQTITAFLHEYLLRGRYNN